MRIQIPFGTVAYRERGVGPTLALLHAFPLFSEMWEPQLEVLHDVARVVAVDMRGFVGTPLGDRPYDLEDLARDLADVMDALGVERFVLGGLSMGGYVALAFQRLFGERLNGLVLADSRAAADAPAARERRYQTIAEVETKGVAGLAASMPNTLLSSEASPALRERVRAWIAEADPRAVIAAQRAMAERPDSTDRLASIRVPTLVVVGDQDTLSPPEEAERMASMLPNGRLVRVPHAGHLSSLENPSAFNEAVRAFMGAIAP